MQIPGEKFDLSLSDLINSSDDVSGSSDFGGMGKNFMGDIVENTVDPTLVVAPSLPAANRTGFPAHKKRFPKGGRPEGGMLSRFKQQKQQQQVWKENTMLEEKDTRTERERISDENQARVDAMGEERIRQEQKELREMFGEGVLQAFLNRKKAPAPAKEGEPVVVKGKKMQQRNGGGPKMTVGFSDSDEISDEMAASTLKAYPDLDTTIIAPLTSSDTCRPDPDPKPPTTAPTLIDDDAAPPSYDATLFPPPSTYHFPRAPAPPVLDPSSATFLTDLHEAYFPNLPQDPSKLSWMLPAVPDADDYSPEITSFTASSLRFDFSGDIIPPSKALSLPVTLGLHHHAQTPDAAGYTIPELALLARSSFAAQRCVAIMVFGRILYKLGVGKYRSSDKEDTTVENALWTCIADGKIIESLEETAAGSGKRHLSVQTYATEALWLWQKGGGRRPKWTPNINAGGAGGLGEILAGMR